eukprot:NODE_574_length_1795_cov_29.661271_g565_i0.p1 GENE.NODE_574_length_1795_cov_29.661271_g565_i0~~NODE_574_length_1795_cov_29.661271_g565_i0.p1  ORF type:complete len:518 (+),score=73.35 NODE_574_length_1795_cov_29.661271_g565_i0:139-1692(+)
MSDVVTLLQTPVSAEQTADASTTYFAQAIRTLRQNGVVGATRRGVGRRGVVLAHATDPTLVLKVGMNVSNFQHEAAMLELLADVPGIVKLHGSDVYDKVAVLTLAACEYPLSQLEAPVNSSILRTVARQLLKVVRDMHLKGVAHGDITLQNIMVTNGQLELIDLGSAVQIQRVNQLPAGTVGHTHPIWKQQPNGTAMQLMANDYFAIGASLARLAHEGTYSHVNEAHHLPDTTWNWDDMRVEFETDLDSDLVDFLFLLLSQEVHDFTANGLFQHPFLLGEDTRALPTVAEVRSPALEVSSCTSSFTGYAYSASSYDPLTDFFGEKLSDQELDSLCPASMRRPSFNGGRVVEFEQQCGRKAAFIETQDSRYQNAVYYGRDRVRPNHAFDTASIPPLGGPGQSPQYVVDKKRGSQHRRTDDEHDEQLHKKRRTLDYAWPSYPPVTRAWDSIGAQPGRHSARFGYDDEPEHRRGPRDPRFDHRVRARSGSQRAAKRSNTGKLPRAKRRRRSQASHGPRRL